MCNFIALNDLVLKDPYELENRRDFVRATEGSRIFTVIDLKEGFYNIEIRETVKHKTAFEFDGVVYEWLNNNNLSVNSSKLQLGLSLVKLLGATVAGISQTPSEIEKNKALEYHCKAEMRRFLGLSGWFRQFIGDYAKQFVLRTL